MLGPKGRARVFTISASASWSHPNIGMGRSSAVHSQHPVQGRFPMSQSFHAGVLARRRGGGRLCRSPPAPTTKWRCMSRACSPAWAASRRSPPSSTSSSASVAADKRINSLLPANADIPDLKGKLVDLICQGHRRTLHLQSRQDYEGRTRGHGGGRRATSTRWSRTWSPPSTNSRCRRRRRAELLGILGPMKGAIVEG